MYVSIRLIHLLLVVISLYVLLVTPVKKPSTTTPEHTSIKLGAFSSTA